MKIEAKFKVGDKVKCVDPGDHERIANGECYVVATTRPGNFLTLEGNEVGVYSFARFELLPATVTPAPVEGGKAFKIGDRVRIAKPWDGLGYRFAGSSVGQVFDVMEVTETSAIGNCCGMNWNIHIDYLEHAAAQPAPKPASPISPDPYAAERTGPYGGSDLGHEQVVAALTLRDAKVKVLRAEMGREPMKPRFPSPGRFDGLPCHEWPKGDERNEP